MEMSLGFFVILVLILFPGLIFRRLYFYGEFSKEFKAEYNLITLLAIATIPGIINLICVFYFYDRFLIQIDIGEIIDKFKDLNNPQHRMSETEGTPIKNLINSKVAPFIGFLYVVIVLLGATLGRFIRISKVDTKFKTLRFKNFWFYLLSGQHTGFKKMKHFRKRNKKHVFTKADILIDSSSKTYLYSGIVVDYELKDNDCSALSKIMLQNANRYSLRDGKKIAVGIPGNLLVVDCSTMKNINLTYVYEEIQSILKSKLPNSIEIAFGLTILILIPFFIFRAENLNLEIYNQYFNLVWYEKLITYLLSIQLLNLLNPFIKKNEEYKWVNCKSLLAKGVWIIVWALLLWILTK